MFKSLLIVTSIVLFPLSLIQAQVSQEWVRRYGGPDGNISHARKVVADTKGNVYVTGDSWGDSTNSDYTTIKYNSSGVQKWIQRYSSIGNNIDISRDIVVDNSGNVYVTGYVIEDFATIKYDSLGVQQWIQIYNGPANSSDRAYAIALDDFDNVYVTGYSRGMGTSDDFATIKYNSQGIQQWVSTYNGTANSDDAANSISVDNFGNTFVSGASTGTGTGYDFTTIKYNSTGVQQWARIYNGPGNSSDAGISTAIDNVGNVIVSGYSIGVSGNYDGTTIKYNSLGVLQWTQIYNDSANNADFLRSVKSDSSGNVYTTGLSVGNGTGQDIITIKYNSEGFQQWVQRYNYTNGDDGGVSLALDNTNNIYIAGTSETTSGQKDYDYVTLKYNSSGVIQWVQRYNGTGNGIDIAQSVAVDNMGGVFITGQSVGNVTPAYEFATIKYSQPTNITIGNSRAVTFSLNQNYPNPFNPTTTISFSISKNSFVKLQVFNITGKEIKTLVNDYRQAGSYNVTFDAANLPSGVYYYELSTGQNTSVKRMVLLK